MIAVEGTFLPGVGTPVFFYSVWEMSRIFRSAAIRDQLRRALRLCSPHLAATLTDHRPLHLQPQAWLGVVSFLYICCSYVF